MGAALFYFLAWIFKKEHLAVTAFSLLILAVFSLAVSAGTGLYAEPGVMVSRSVRDGILLPHKRFMLATSWFCVFLAVWAIIRRPFPKKGRVLFMVFFLLITGLMIIGADYGGRLVYDYNAGGDACRQPIEFKK